MKRIRDFSHPKRSQGASLLEYGIILGLLGVVAVPAVLRLGEEISVVLSLSADEVHLAHRGPLDPNAFAIEVSGGSATIYPMAGSSIVVDWGSDTANADCGVNFTAGSPISCAYPEAGSYRVTILGDMTAYGDAAGATTNGSIVSVLQWGRTGLTSLQNAFVGAVNLTEVPGNLPSTVTSLEEAFSGASSMNDPSVASWDTSSVEVFDGLFRNATSFNVDIGGWDVSSATRMYQMFNYASSFDQDIGGWDVSSLQITHGMFRGATAFSHDIGGWDVSQVTNMQAMFMETSYDADLSSWDTASLTHMPWMFTYNTAFDSDISGWDVSKVGSFRNAFQGATNFSADISGWDVSSATEMDEMLRGTSSLASDLSGWCVSGIASEPPNFSTGSGISAAPIWGTCP